MNEKVKFSCQILTLVRTVILHTEFTHDKYFDLEELKIELYKNSDTNEFEFLLYRNERYRIQSCMPSDEDGRPLDHPSDEELWLRDTKVDVDLRGIQDENTALRLILEKINEFFERIS